MGDEGANALRGRLLYHGYCINDQSAQNESAVRNVFEDVEVLLWRDIQNVCTACACSSDVCARGHIGLSAVGSWHAGILRQGICNDLGAFESVLEKSNRSDDYLPLGHAC